MAHKLAYFPTTTKTASFIQRRIQKIQRWGAATAEATFISICFHSTNIVSLATLICFFPFSFIDF